MLKGMSGLMLPSCTIPFDVKSSGWRSTSSTALRPVATANPSTGQRSPPSAIHRS